MKNKIPPFEELIDRLAVCIQKRNPEKDVGETAKGILAAKWKHKPKQLYTMVKALEIQEFRQKQFDDSFEEKVIEFQIGNSISGEPIIVKHFIKTKKLYIKNKVKHLIVGKKQTKAFPFF